jgi:hypothetical protein
VVEQDIEDVRGNLRRLRRTLAAEKDKVRQGGGQGYLGQDRHGDGYAKCLTDKELILRAEAVSRGDSR